MAEEEGGEGENEGGGDSNYGVSYTMPILYWHFASLDGS
jgi:hypothetical protein